MLWHASRQIVYNLPTLLPLILPNTLCREQEVVLGKCKLLQQGRTRGPTGIANRNGIIVKSRGFPSTQQLSVAPLLCKLLPDTVFALYTVISVALSDGKWRYFAGVPARVLRIDRHGCSVWGACWGRVNWEVNNVDRRWWDRWSLFLLLFILWWSIITTKIVIIMQ